MLTYTATFVAATVLALGLTPLVRLFALRIGAVSEGGGRHVHAQAMPRLGGVAIAVAAFVPLALLLVLESEVARIVRADWQRAVGIGVGAVVMGATGAWDDVRRLRAIHKLGIQLLCAIGAYVAGFQIQVVALPFVGNLDMGVFGLPITVLWIVGVTNAVNLIDGLDGLAAGVVFFAAATNLVVALIGGNVFVAVVMAALMGALFGFLFYNWNPAKLFMGDSGSYFLGFMLATTSLVGSQKASTAVSLLVPVLALGVPIFDTLFSIVRRWLEKRPIFSPDRGHVHHRLLDMGLTHRRAVLTLYGLSVLFAGTGVLVSVGRDWQTGVAIVLALVIVIGLIRFVGTVDRARLTVAPVEGAWVPVVTTLEENLPELLLRLAAVDPAGHAALLAEWAPRLGFSRLRVLPVRAPSKLPGQFVFSPSVGEGTLVVEPGTSEPCPPEARALLQLLADVLGRRGISSRGSP